MTPNNIYDIALVVAGIVIGIFLIRIFGDNTRSRYRRYRRHYGRYRGRRYEDDDEDDYDYDHGEDRRGSGCMVLLVLAAASVIAWTMLGKHNFTDLLKSESNSGNKTSVRQNQSENSENSLYLPTPELDMNETLDTSKVTVKTPDSIGENAQEEQVVEYYIRVHVLGHEAYIDPCCIKLRAQGFNVFTMKKVSGTGIYVGPYQTKAAAEKINSSKNLGGVVEGF